MKKLYTPHYRKDRDRWEWRGIFRQHPKKNGRPTELTLGTFDEFPAEKNFRGKYQPVDPERLFQRWAEKERDLDSDRKNRPWKYFADLGTVRAMFSEYENTEEFRSLRTLKIRLTQNRFWIKQLGHVKIVDLSPRMIASKRKILKSRFGPSTVNNYLTAFSAAYRAMSFFWSEEGIKEIPPNPVIYRYKLDNKRVRKLSPEERAKLYHAIRDNPGLNLLVRLGLSTGGRLRELAGLTWDRVDLKKGWLKLIKTKTGHDRIVVVRGETLEYLRAWAKVRRIDVPWVFPGRFKNFTIYRKPFVRAVKDAGIDDFTFHDLRHSCASYLAENRVDTKRMMIQMGWTQEQTGQRYWHLREGVDLEFEAEMMAEILDEKTTKKRPRRVKR